MWGKKGGGGKSCGKVECRDRRVMNYVGLLQTCTLRILMLRDFVLVLNVLPVLPSRPQT